MNEAVYREILMYIGIISLGAITGIFLVSAFEAIMTGVRKLKRIYADRRRVREKPVVHGRWIQVDETKCRCSNCDIIALIGLYPHGDMNYCPNCGAKMDEEETHDC